MSALSKTVSVPVWLVMAAALLVYTSNTMLYSNAVHSWRLTDQAQANARSCDDYLQPGVKYSNLSEEQRAHYDKCNSKPTTTTKGE